MILSIQQIQSTMKSLVHGGFAGWRPEKGADPLTAGTIVNGCYRIEDLVKLERGRRLYTVTLVSRREICHGGRPRGEVTYHLSSNECGAKPAGRIFRLEVFPRHMDLGLIKKLLGISHPRIVRIHNIFVMEPNSYVVSESVRGVTLDRPEAMLTGEQIRMVGVCLTQTVEFLHAQGVYRMDLHPSNLELVGDRPRLISLTTCWLKSHVSRKELERFDREDFRGLLETLEKLAAESDDQDRGDMLCRLLVTLEEMIGKDELCAREIQEALVSL